MLGGLRPKLFKKAKLVYEVGHPGTRSRDINIWGTIPGFTCISYEKSDFLTPYPELIRVYETFIMTERHCDQQSK